MHCWRVQVWSLQVWLKDGAQPIGHLTDTFWIHIKRERAASPLQSPRLRSTHEPCCWFVFCWLYIITPHLNLHLAKLHIHVFSRAIYGFEVKVFQNNSAVSQLNFQVSWKSTFAVALAHCARANFVSRDVHNSIYIRNIIYSTNHIWLVEYFW